jgi:hypothetical protein
MGVRGPQIRQRFSVLLRIDRILYWRRINAVIKAKLVKASDAKPRMAIGGDSKEKNR